MLENDVNSISFQVLKEMNGIKYAYDTTVKGAIVTICKRNGMNICDKSGILPEFASFVTEVLNQVKEVWNGSF